MQKALVIICLSLLLGSCEKNESEKRELIITANGVLSGGSHVSLDDSDGAFGKGYSVYLHKGEIEITDELLKNPAHNSCNSSRGIFFKTVHDGIYTVIVDVYYIRDGVFGSGSYSGVGYTTIKYPNPNVSKTFTFNWNKNVSTYIEDGITYANLRPQKIQTSDSFHEKTAYIPLKMRHTQKIRRRRGSNSQSKLEYSGL